MAEVQEARTTLVWDRNASIELALNMALVLFPLLVPLLLLLPFPCPCPGSCSCMPRFSQVSVYNDCSTDRSPEIIRQWAERLRANGISAVYSGGAFPPLTSLQWQASGHAGQNAAVASSGTDIPHTPTKLQPRLLSPLPSLMAAK